MSSPGSGSGGPPPPPPKPPPPPPLHTSKSLWDPIGDPGKLRAAAGAWSALGGALDGVAAGVRTDAGSLLGSWGGSAADAFHAWASKLSGEVAAAAGECRAMAAHLDEVAGYLESKNAAIHRLYEAMAAAAVVGIGFSIITFGFSDAAAAGAGAALAAEAGTEVAEAGTFLSAASGVISQFASRFAVYLGMWAKGLAFSATATEAVKAAVHGAPLSWSIDDVTAVVDGATGFAAVPGGFMEARPLLGGALAAGGGQALTSSLAGDPLSATSIEEVLAAAAMGGALNRGWTAAHGALFAPSSADPVELPGRVDPAGPTPLVVSGPGDVAGALGLVRAPAPGALEAASPIAGYRWDGGLLLPDTPPGTVRTPEGLYTAPQDPIPPGRTPLYVVRAPVERGSIPQQVAGSVSAVLRGSAPPGDVVVVEVGAPPAHDVAIPLPGGGEVTLDPGRGLRSVSDPTAIPSQVGQPAGVGALIEVIWPAKDDGGLSGLPPVVIEVAPPPPTP